MRISWTLWKNSFQETKWLLLASMAILVVFNWLFVWVVSQLPLEQLRLILNLVPKNLESLLPVPKEQIATSAGRIAIAYDHPIVILVTVFWAIGRGSDAVSGELGRGTLEMILAQPVRRVTWLATHAASTNFGSAILAASVWLGTSAGLATVEMDEVVSVWAFLPAVLNLFGLMFCLAGISTLASSGDRYRWRTIGLVGGFYVIELMIKVAGLAAPTWKWLLSFSLFTCFEPQWLVSNPAAAWSLLEPARVAGRTLGGLGCDGVLIGIGLTSYMLAAVIFCHRDLPAPL
jgi:ABC-2 type transport system permease protein